MAAAFRSSSGWWWPCCRPSIGLLIGLVSGYSRIADAILMRFMDGLMSIPAILLAIALMAVVKASITTVIVAITIVEVPRVVRLVRSVVLSIREQPYVEAAVIVGSRFGKILFRHILPNTLAPLTVQATYICAAAILIESLLSFLGAGTPPEVPSWGNIMAEGRSYFLLAPWIIFTPGLVLADDRARHQPDGRRPARHARPALRKAAVSTRCRCPRRLSARRLRPHEPVLAVEHLRTSFHTHRRRRARGRRRELDARARRNPRHRR